VHRDNTTCADEGGDVMESDVIHIEGFVAVGRDARMWRIEGEPEIGIVLLLGEIQITMQNFFFAFF
jgi:hypothetical protein